MGRGVSTQTDPSSRLTAGETTIWSTPSALATCSGVSWLEANGDAIQQVGW
jgi:hypothetical protein